MNKQQRNRSFYLALLMNKMHIHRSMLLDIHLDFIVRKGVELSFVRSPVEFRAPVFDDTLDVFSTGDISVLEVYRRIRWESHKGAP